MADDAEAPLPGQFGYMVRGAPQPGADTGRSTLRSVGDFALDVGRIVPETYRSVMETGRSIEDQPRGWWARRAKEASDVMDWYDSLQSDRARQVAEKKFFPGVDDQSAWSDLPAVAAHHIAGVVPFLL